MGDKQKRHHNHKTIDHMFRRSPVAGDLKRKPHRHHGRFIDGIGKDELWKLALTPIILVLAIFFLVPLMGLLAGGWGVGPGMMGRMMGGVSPNAERIAAGTATVNWSSVAWILLVAFIAGAGLLGWLAVARARGTGKAEEKRETPLEIAQNRYVLGEISLAEYEEILQVLLEGNGPLKLYKGPPRNKMSP